MNAPTIALSGVRSLAHDPVMFGMQVTRRFAGLRSVLDDLTGRGESRAATLLHLWSAGEQDALTEQLQRDAASVEGLGVVGAEIATAAGHPDLVVDDVRLRPIARARAAWMLGDVKTAFALVPSRSRYAKTLVAERAMMTPGMRLSVGVGDAEAHGDTVLHVLTNSLPHTQSGYTIRSHNVLLAQREAGLAVEAVTRPGYPLVTGSIDAQAVDVVEGISYTRVLPAVLASQPDRRLQQHARTIVRLGAGARLLHTTTNYANAIAVQAAAGVLGIPWAYEVRGMQEQTWIATLHSAEARERAVRSERYRLIRAREAQLASASDVVFTLSEGMRQDLMARGVDGDSVHVMPNGIPAARLEQPTVAAPDARAELGLSREGFWVGAVSSLVGYEGFDTLIDAVKRIRASGTDVRLLLVGDGVERPALVQQAADLGEAAVLPGRVDAAQAQRYLSALDVVVVPRRDLEVTRSVAPLKPIEALAAGKPLLVSDLPPLTETIGDELVTAGCAVAPSDAGALADALTRLSGDEALRNKLGELGRARAATRTWEHAGERYAEHYARLTGG
ncbi:glycosyltransferase family 4 protein [Agrococcus casei]|uniref:glycosyltransferase family 4 protein n=1 Tax=Agrococcus casei TaxID=343512 RepID=UPI003F8FCE46